MSAFNKVLFMLESMIHNSFLVACHATNRACTCGLVRHKRFHSVCFVSLKVVRINWTNALSFFYESSDACFLIHENSLTHNTGFCSLMRSVITGSQQGDQKKPFLKAVFVNDISCNCFQKQSWSC